jgi:hypothetical protein
MTSVEVQDTPMKYEELHEFFKPDIFGFQGKSMNKEIELEMSMRAYILLKEEFPMSAAFIKPLPDSGKYYFKAQVQSFLAPGRFVMGFSDEVNVVGSKEFLQFIKKMRRR